MIQTKLRVITPEGEIRPAETTEDLGARLALEAQYWRGFLGFAAMIEHYGFQPEKAAQWASVARKRVARIEGAR